MVQVVGKACKPIPVLILSGLVGRKSYNYVKYLCVLTLVLGITMFLYHPTDETVQKVSVDFLPIPTRAGKSSFLLSMFSWRALARYLEMFTKCVVYFSFQTVAGF